MCALCLAPLAAQSQKWMTRPPSLTPNTCSLQVRPYCCRLNLNPKATSCKTATCLQTEMRHRDELQPGTAIPHCVHRNSEPQQSLTPRDGDHGSAADDNIVVLRAASRAEPPTGTGSLSLSFSKGIVFDSNAANRSLEHLRKACLLCSSSKFNCLPEVSTGLHSTPVICKDLSYHARLHLIQPHACHCRMP